MEKGQPSQRGSSDDDSFFTVPRGGPIFVHDFVSSLTRAPDFESHVFSELNSLKAELGDEPTDVEDEDISVDELRIYSDEDLVAEAMRIAFENDAEAKTSSDLAEGTCISGVQDCPRMLDAGTSASFEPSNNTSSNSSYDGEEENVSLMKIKKQNNKKKRKQNNKKKQNAKQDDKSKKGKTKKLINGGKDKPVDDSYLEKVEHLAEIRQKQEEDKASVKLHSFNHGKDNTAALSSGNIETLKYLEPSSYPFKVKCSLDGKPGPIQYPEVILCVEVYHYKCSWKKTQEFLVLGTQTLTELRDKIYCLGDVVMQKADAYDPSGYFLIEEAFCNDMRNPSAIDYSEPIFDWLKNSKEEALTKWNSIQAGVGKRQKIALVGKPLSKLPNFRSLDMQTTRFCELGFRIGAGYLYCHQGACKHVIAIRDMRLIHPDDVQNRAAYPLLVYQHKVILKKCTVCRIYKATKVTLDDKLAGENPCYFCDNCYFLLHYSEEGNLLYNSFTVHDYLQEY